MDTSDFALLKEAAHQDRFEFEFDLPTLVKEQKRDLMLRIVRRHLKYIDALKELDDVPSKIKRDVLKGKYFIEEETDLLKYQHSSGKALKLLPLEHRKVFLQYYHQNLETGERSYGKGIVEGFLLVWPPEGHQMVCKELLGVPDAAEEPAEAGQADEVVPAEDAEHRHLNCLQRPIQGDAEWERVYCFHHGSV